MAEQKKIKPSLRNLAAGDVIFKEERLEILLIKLSKER